MRRRAGAAVRLTRVRLGLTGSAMLPASRITTRARTVAVSVSIAVSVAVVVVVAVTVSVAIAVVLQNYRYNN